MANLDLISANKCPMARIGEFRRKINGEARTVMLEYADPTRADAEKFAENLTKYECVDRASLLCARAFDMKTPPHESAVYVITNEDKTMSKIGVAKHPLRRLSGLQSGNWQRLYIAGLCWVLDGAVYGVENLALRVAKRMEKRLKGEWMEAPPQDAAFILASTALSIPSVKVADSGMWLRNLDYMAAQNAELEKAA